MADLVQQRSNVGAPPQNTSSSTSSTTNSNNNNNINNTNGTGATSSSNSSNNHNSNNDDQQQQQNNNNSSSSAPDESPDSHNPFDVQTLRHGQMPSSTPMGINVDLGNAHLNTMTPGMGMPGMAPPPPPGSSSGPPGSAGGLSGGGINPYWETSPPTTPMTASSTTTVGAFRSARPMTAPSFYSSFPSNTSLINASASNGAATTLAPSLSLTGVDSLQQQQQQQQLQQQQQQSSDSQQQQQQLYNNNATPFSHPGLGQNGAAPANNVSGAQQTTINAGNVTSNPPNSAGAAPPPPPFWDFSQMSAAHSNLANAYQTGGVTRPEMDMQRRPYTAGAVPYATGQQLGAVSVPGGTFIPNDSRLTNFMQVPDQQPKKRARRRYDEIERMYSCNFPGCTKAYGTLNHLNAHINMQKHGEKRLPHEFKEIRREYRNRKKAEEQAQKRKASEAAQAHAAVMANNPAAAAAAAAAAGTPAALGVHPSVTGNFGSFDNPAAAVAAAAAAAAASPFGHQLVTSSHPSQQVQAAVLANTNRLHNSSELGLPPGVTAPPPQSYPGNPTTNTNSMIPSQHPGSADGSMVHPFYNNNGQLPTAPPTSASLQQHQPYRQTSNPFDPPPGSSNGLDSVDPSTTTLSVPSMNSVFDTRPTSSSGANPVVTNRPTTASSSSGQASPSQDQKPSLNGNGIDDLVSQHKQQQIGVTNDQSWQC